MPCAESTKGHGSQEICTPPNWCITSLNQFLDQGNAPIVRSTGGKMKTFSRRDVLKTSLLAPAVAATAHAIGPVGPMGSAAVAGEVSGPFPAPASLASPAPGAGR